MNIEIRQMDIGSEDAQVLLAELNERLTVITGDDGTAHFRKTDVKADHAVFLICYLDGKPMGCGALRRINDREGEIKRIYARPNTAGVGRHIMKALERYAADYGYSTLLLETRVRNEHAIRFYEANGYTHCASYGVYQGNDQSYCFRKELL